MASIIKAGQIHPGGQSARPAAFNFEDMSDTATKYLGSVREQAEQIVLQAHEQAKQVLVQAEQQGKQNAEKAARQVATAELNARWQTLAPALEQAIRGTAQLKTAWIREWERSALHLIVAIAERVIRSELGRRPDISQAWIREALELATSADKITLQLNPDDFEHLGDARATIAAQLGQLAASDIVPDPSITPGGCRVLTEHGQIDQQIETQLARIEEELTA